MSNQYVPSEWSGQGAELAEKIKAALKETGNSSGKAAKILGMSSMTFYRYCIKFGLRKRRPGGRGTACMKPRVPLHEIIEGKHPDYGWSSLKSRLVEEGLKTGSCESCGIGSIWNNRNLTLQLHHVDGNNKNNSLENLQILCPNCHSQTHNYAGKRSPYNKMDPEELRELVKTTNENSSNLREASEKFGVSPGYFRKLLIRFSL